MFEWDACGNYRYQHINDKEDHLYLPDHTQTPKQVRRFQADYGKETILGINLTSDGNNSEQYTTTQKTIKSWIDVLSPNVFTRTSAKLAFMSTIVAIIRNIMESSTFTRGECESLQKRLYKMTLTKIGVISHIPTVFRYAPKCFQGLALPNIYTDQGIYQIIHFLKHIGEDSQDGKMIIIGFATKIPLFFIIDRMKILIGYILD